jgi:tripartite-type tricarboxylate transporter receptor subunit TctC
MKSKNMLRFAATTAITAAIAAFGACAPALAAYPEQPIKVIVPYTAGGSSDVIARAISDELTAELGQSVIVENRAGAGSMIGTAYVASEKPDGYTLLLADVPFTIVPALYGDRVKYNAATDFAPISLLGLSPMYLFKNPSFPANSVGEVVEMARAKPGSISIGSGGNGSLTHLMAELLMLNTGTKLVHIPYKGASASVNDLAGGQIQLSFTTMPTATALYQGKKILPLGVSSPQRQSETPDVPTFQEVGIPNMAVQSWWGLVAPARTPQPVLARLNAAMDKVMRSPKVQGRLASVGVNVPTDTSAAALQGLLTADLARWKDVVTRADIKFE